MDALILKYLLIAFGAGLLVGLVFGFKLGFNLFKSFRNNFNGGYNPFFNPWGNQMPGQQQYNESERGGGLFFVILMLLFVVVLLVFIAKSVVGNLSFTDNNNMTTPKASEKFILTDHKTKSQTKQYDIGVEPLEIPEFVTHSAHKSGEKIDKKDTTKDRSGFYAVKVVSYKNWEKVEKVIKNLENRGFKANYYKIQKDGEIWFGVYAGPYTSIANAEAVKSEINISGATIVPFNDLPK